MGHLRQDYSTVKLLIMNPPATDSFQQPLEVTVEYDKERQDCLRTLYFKNSRYDKISKHYDHTFKWLWETPQYHSWNRLERSSPGLLLIEGKPGSGKSTLLRYFKDHFDASQIASPGTAVIANFFYSYRDGGEKNHRNMLQVVLHQILKADESFFIHFQQEYRQLGHQKTAWDLTALKRILHACTKHPLQRIIFLIIDAMDESDCTDRVDIIQFLQNLSNPTQNNSRCVVKTFLGSRPMNELPDDWLGCHRILLQEENKKDIETYTREALQNQVFNSIKSIKEIESYIVEYSVGVFLWVRLVIDELVQYVRKGSRQSKVLSFLKSLPKELEAYYEHMLQGLSSDEPEATRDSRRVLQFCLFSHRAIELVELDHALAISGQVQEPEPDSSSWESERPTDIRRLLNHCVGSFIDIKYNNTQVPNGKNIYVVQVMHQTVRDFFLRPHGAVARSHLNITNTKDALTMIQLTSIRYLQIHHTELNLEFNTPADQWHHESSCKFVQYLDTRPFIKYSLECLTQDQGTIAPLVSERLSNLVYKVQKSSSPGFCLLKRLVTSDTGPGCSQDQLDHLLRLAAMKGCATAVANLLTATADIDSVSNDGRTSLHLAAAKGHDSAVVVLLDRGAMIEAKVRSDTTALHLAAALGHNTVVVVLLDRGAMIEAKATLDRTALHLAADKGCDAVAEVLLDRGAIIEAKDSFGRTALHLATRGGYKSIAQLLLDRGADIQAIDHETRTPLMLAARCGNTPISQLLLLDYGASVLGNDNKDFTALHLAAIHGSKATAKFLLDRGSDVRAKGNRGRTALHLMAMYGFEDIAQLLLDHGASVLDKDYEGYTALHLAVIYRSKALAKFLLDRGSEVRAKGHRGRTALHLAAAHGFEDIVQLLLDRGADVFTKDNEGQTALHLAAIYRSEDIVQVLKIEYREV